MPDGYLTQCAKVMEDLNAAVGIDVDHAEIDVPTIAVLADPDWVFGDIEEHLGMPLNARFRDVFFAANRVQSFWLSEDDDHLRGEFCLEPLHLALFRGHFPLDGLGNTLTGAERKVIRELRIIDQEPMAGTGRLTGMRAVPGSENPEIWFFDWRKDLLLKLDLDYASYLETVLVTKGTYGWQYLFADTDLQGPEFHDTLQGLTSMLEVFPALFPGHDYEDLRTRLMAV